MNSAKKTTSKRLVSLIVVLAFATSIFSFAIPAVAAYTAWAPNTAYSVGAMVTYGGSDYQCRQAHTSLVGWEPPNVPALWLLIPGGTTPTPTPVKTPTPTPVKTPTPTPVKTPTSTPVKTPTPTPVKTPTPTPVKTPTPTPVKTPTPGPTTNPNLPKRIMVGYYHTWGGNNPFIKLRDVDPNWDVINISFAEPITPGSGDGRMKFEVSGISTITGYTLADFKADIKTLQSRGKKVVLSIGGYEGWFYLGSSTAITQFVNDIKGFVNEYGFDGIDIDLEQDSIMFNQGNDPYYKNPTSPRIVNMISAIRQICNSYGSNFILSWAPETFYMQNGLSYYAGINQYCLAKAGCYIPLIHALRDKTTYVHVQLYNSAQMKGNDGNYYNMGTTEGIVAMCEMLLSGFKIMGMSGSDYFFDPLRPDQVVIGVPASAGAAGSGQISNAGLQQSFRTLVAKYPNLRGIMAWSINWDSYQNANSFVRENRAFLNTLP